MKASSARSLVLLLLTSVLVAGCAVNQPGIGVTPEFATEWGCDYQWIADRSARLRIEGWGRRTYRPQVGWTACELLARIGRPVEVDHPQAQEEAEARWWYESRKGRSLITLGLRDDWWIVTSVDWRSE